MLAVLEHPQGRVRGREWGKDTRGKGWAGGRSGSGRERRGKLGTQEWSSPLCSAAAVASERMALPTNTPWRQLKASYTRGTPGTPVHMVKGSPYLCTITPSLLVILTLTLSLLGPQLPIFKPHASPLHLDFAFSRGLLYRQIAVVGDPG